MMLAHRVSDVEIVYNAGSFELNKEFTSFSNFHASQLAESHNSLAIYGRISLALDIENFPNLSLFRHDIETIKEFPFPLWDVRSQKS